MTFEGPTASDHHIGCNVSTYRFGEATNIQTIADKPLAQEHTVNKWLNWPFESSNLSPKPKLLSL